MTTPFIVQSKKESNMKRISKLMVTFSMALFAVGCGKAHDDREASRDGRRLSNETAADVSRTGQEVEHAAHDVSRAVDAATVETETEVRQAALQLRDDVHRQPDAIQVRHDADLTPPADPAQLRQEIKRDAVNAVGAAAEEAAEKLFKTK
jgi:hypothetical protein